MKKLLLSATLLATTAIAWAVPAFRHVKTVTQSDGTQLEIRFTGDENLHYFETLDGIPVARDDKGDWNYATLEVNVMKPLSVMARPADMRTEKDLEAISMAQQSLAGGYERAATIKAPAHMPQKAPLAHRVNMIGQKRGLIILAEFQDVKFSTPNAHEVFEKQANGINYKENGFYGSIRDYFRDQSNGQFDFTFDVVGPITLPETMKYYGEDKYHPEHPEYGLIWDYNGADLCVHACKAIEDQVDFHDYDWDDDGEIDMVFIIYAGYGQNYFNEDNLDMIWPFKGYASHSGYLEDREFTYVDGLFLDVFACHNELIGTSGTQIEGIGGMCHEFSHCFGLKDWYATSGSGAKPMGYWSLMCYGSYNDNSRYPCGYTAYEKMFCGWQAPIILKEACSVKDMQPLHKNGNSYIIFNDAHPKEYLMMEYRQRDGWDKYVPNEGILITQIDYFEPSWQYNTVNNIPNHPRYGVVPADGTNGMSTDDQAGDSYPYVESISGKYNDCLTDDSYPAARWYNKSEADFNEDGDLTPIGKPITNMDFSSKHIAHFDFMGGGAAPDDERFQTGVNTLFDLQQDIVDVYSIDGRNLGRMKRAELGSLRHKGILIVRSADGSVFKTICK